VVIGEDFALQPYSQITTCVVVSSEQEDSDDEGTLMIETAVDSLTNEEHVGIGGVGYKFNRTDEKFNSLGMLTIKITAV